MRVQNGFNVPDDVPLYVPQSVSYPTGLNDTVYGDGNGARGSPAPALAVQPPDIRSFAPGWVLPSNESYPPPPAVTSPTTQEAKFRAHINVSHILPDDPIRNFGKPGTSHLHTFFGNATINAFSTFPTLRNRANERSYHGQSATTGSGGPYNATGYWVPSMMKNGQVVKMDAISLYYTANPATRAAHAQRLPRGLRYVTGFNMDDPDNAAKIAEAAAANAANGSPRYDFLPQYTGFDGWQMLTPDQGTVILNKHGNWFSPSIVEPDGSDPWEGMGAYPGCYLKAGMNGPLAYDGVNLWSPGGYKHVTHGLGDSQLGKITLPNGWVGLPELQLFIFYKHQGWADYSQWYLSSDDHASMVAGRTLPAGTSMHTDWFGAWDDSVFGDAIGWQHDCVSVVDGVTMHTCGSGAFRADGTRLLEEGAAPDMSRNPQVTTENYDSTNPAHLFTIPTGGFMGPVTVPARTP